MTQKRAAAAEIFRQQNLAAPEPQAIPEPAEQFALSDAEADALPQWLASAAGPASSPVYQAQAEHKGANRLALPGLSIVSSEELQLERGPIKARETGFWVFKRVIVPPNAYVVHTRIGRKQPVTIGLGVSFRYNPNKDAYLIVPAAMQTIGIVANCISQEKQGINVLAYVQWQISDFAVAYRKLDFSDPRDPLGVVNAQLREQAEAAIKDKVATMSVEDVLTDKAPVIEELTRRLREVTEGRAQQEGGVDQEGLGIKIVTVQIKEALVSSTRLWENLQAPYRHDQEQAARISYLAMQDSIRQKELETRRTKEIAEAETNVDIERIKQAKETEALTLQLEEAEKRQIREQEMALNTLQRQQAEAVEKARLAAEAEVRKKALEVDRALQVLAEELRHTQSRAASEQARLAQEAVIEEAQHAHRLLLQAQHDAFEAARQAADLERRQAKALGERDVADLASEAEFVRAERIAQIERIEQEIRNLASDNDLLRRWVEQMPAIAEHLPQIEEMRVIQTGGNEDTLSGFLARQHSLFEMLSRFLKNSNTRPANLSGEAD